MTDLSAAIARLRALALDLDRQASEDLALVLAHAEKTKDVVAIRTLDFNDPAALNRFMAEQADVDPGIPMYRTRDATDEVLAKRDGSTDV